MSNPTVDPRPASTGSTLIRWGRTSWMLIGIIVLATTLFTALASVSGLAVPLVIATVIGMLATPIVDALERRRVPRPVGALVVMVGLLAVIVGSIAIAVNGVVDQGDEISRSMAAGIDSIDTWLDGLDLDLGVADQRVEQAKQFGIDLLPGLASWFGSVFSSVFGFLVGGFLGLFLLYYILTDWVPLRGWVSGRLGVPADLGATIVDDATSIIRAGFAALTVSSLVTAALIGATMVLLGLPLAFAVALVTFVTSYVPYLGAIFSAAFACLVALGSGSTTQALFLLVVILVVQNLVQTVVGNKLASDRLSLHPIAGLVSTIVGASVAGLLGATLSAPVVAIAIRIRQRILAHHVESDGRASSPRTTPS